MPNRPPDAFKIELGTGVSPLIKGEIYRDESGPRFFVIHHRIDCNVRHFSDAFNKTFGATLHGLPALPDLPDEYPLDRNSDLWNEEGIVGSTDIATVGMSINPLIQKNDWSRITEQGLAAIISPLPVRLLEWRFNTRIGDVIYDVTPSMPPHRRISIQASLRISEEIAGLCRRTCMNGDVTEYDLKRLLDDALGEFDPL